jgi:hypothetical protein
VLRSDPWTSVPTRQRLPPAAGVAWAQPAPRVLPRTHLSQLGRPADRNARQALLRAGRWFVRRGAVIPRPELGHASLLPDKRGHGSDRTTCTCASRDPGLGPRVGAHRLVAPSRLQAARSLSVPRETPPTVGLEVGRDVRCLAVIDRLADACWFSIKQRGSRIGKPDGVGPYRAELRRCRWPCRSRCQGRRGRARTGEGVILACLLSAADDQARPRGTRSQPRRSLIGLAATAGSNCTARPNLTRSAIRVRPASPRRGR